MHFVPTIPTLRTGLLRFNTPCRFSNMPRARRTAADPGSVTLLWGLHQGLRIRRPRPIREQQPIMRFVGSLLSGISRDHFNPQPLDMDSVLAGHTQRSTTPGATQHTCRSMPCAALYLDPQNNTRYSLCHPTPSGTQLGFLGRDTGSWPGHWIPGHADGGVAPDTKQQRSQSALWLRALSW